MQRQLTDYHTCMDDTEKAVSNTLAREGIMFPCSVARQFPIGETRCNHIKYCPDCQRLIKELDKIAYGK